MFDIITFGSATQDIIIKPKNLTLLKYSKDEEGSKSISFPVGSKIDVEKMDFYSGGGGTNTAATFALQGFKTAFCGMVGEDASGQEVVDELKNLKVAVALLEKTDEKLTNHSIIILNPGEDRTILAYRGAAELIKDIPFKKIKTKWIYIAPLSGLLCDSFEQLVNFACQNNIKVAVNPGMAQLALPNFSDIAKKIDVLVLNQEEAGFLTKTPIHQESQIFKKLDEICPGIAVMTKGEHGAVISDGKTMYSAVPPVNRNIVDTTGAGDAFGSGFVAEFIRANDIEKSVQFAMANSVGCISKIGAKSGLLKRREKFERVEVVKEKVLPVLNKVEG